LIREKEYYVPIQDWLEKKHGCYVGRDRIEGGFIEFGNTEYQVDVLGVRNLDDPSRLEIITVEVKSSDPRGWYDGIGKTVTNMQFSHFVYFAAPIYSMDYFRRMFEKTLTRLGIGFIRLDIDTPSVLDQLLPPKRLEPDADLLNVWVKRIK